MSYLTNNQGHIRRNKTGEKVSGVHNGRGKSSTLKDEAKQEAGRIERINNDPENPCVTFSVFEMVENLKEEIQLKLEKSLPTEGLENKLEMYRKIAEGVKIA